MDTVAKIAAAAVLASAVCLLLKRSNPEMGLPLSLVVCAGGFAVAAGLLGPILELLDAARRLSGLSDTLFYPVVKGVGIGICSKLGAEICRDSGQGAIAGAVETVGTVCALYAALPLMSTLLDMLEALV